MMTNERLTDAMKVLMDEAESKRALRSTRSNPLLVRVCTGSARLGWYYCGNEHIGLHSLEMHEVPSFDGKSSWEMYG